MGSGASKFAPEGMYAHAFLPPFMPYSMAASEGPTLILVGILCLLAGANLALYGVYVYLFSLGRKRDPLLLQAAVLLSVICSVVIAVAGFVAFYQRCLIQLYTPQGFDMNALEWYVPLFHTFQAIPDAIGQIYFALRIAKLFDIRKTVVRVALGLAMAGITVQFVLMTWFGVAFYTVQFKSRLLDPKKRHWVKSIIFAWAIIFIVLEFAMTATTMARLLILRRQTSMDAARRVIFRLAVYSLQGQIVLTIASLTSLWLFVNSVTGWYTPLYLANGALYTFVLLANLIYRQAVSEAMRKAHSDYSPSGEEHQHPAQKFNFNAVQTFPETNSHIRLDRMPDQAPKERSNSERDTICSSVGGATGDARRSSWSLDPDTMERGGGQQGQYLNSQQGQYLNSQPAPQVEALRAITPIPLLLVESRSSFGSTSPPQRSPGSPF